MTIQEATLTEPLLTPKAVANVLGKSPQTVHRMVRQGTLPVVRLPHTRGFRFRPSDLASVIAGSIFIGNSEVCHL